MKIKKHAAIAATVSMALNFSACDNQHYAVYGPPDDFDYIENIDNDTESQDEAEDSNSETVSENESEDNSDTSDTDTENENTEEAVSESNDTEEKEE